MFLTCSCRAIICSILRGTQILTENGREPPAHVLPLCETFETDIRRHVITYLPHAPAHRGGLQAMPMRDLMDIYVNWNQRLVFPRPRRIHWSRALLENPLRRDPIHRADFSALVAKIRNGEELTPHLSKGVRHGYKPVDLTTPKALSKRRDLDLLLNDWLIHHLHVSSKVGSDGFFVERGDLLLFAVFKPHDAYLIDLMGHKNWEHEHLLEVIVLEWPDRGLAGVLHGILPGQPFSREDRKHQRNVGMATHLNIDGKVVVGAGCLSTAGTSGSAQHDAGRLQAGLSAFLHRIADNPNHVADILRARGQAVPDKLDLHFVFFRTGGYGIVDTQIGEIVRL